MSSGSERAKNARIHVATSSGTLVQRSRQLLYRSVHDDANELAGVAAESLERDVTKEREDPAGLPFPGVVHACRGHFCGVPDAKSDEGDGGLLAMGEVREDELGVLAVGRGGRRWELVLGEMRVVPAREGGDEVVCGGVDPAHPKERSGFCAIPDLIMVFNVVPVTKIVVAMCREDAGRAEA